MARGWLKTMTRLARREARQITGHLLAQARDRAARPTSLGVIVGVAQHLTGRRIRKEIIYEVRRSDAHQSTSFRPHARVGTEVVVEVGDGTGAVKVESDGERRGSIAKDVKA